MSLKNVSPTYGGLLVCQLVLVRCVPLSQSLQLHLLLANRVLESDDLRDPLTQLLLSCHQTLLHDHQLLLMVGQLQVRGQRLGVRSRWRSENSAADTRLDRGIGLKIHFCL